VCVNLFRAALSVVQFWGNRYQPNYKHSLIIIERMRQTTQRKINGNNLEGIKKCIARLLTLNLCISWTSLKIAAYVLC